MSDDSSEIYTHRATFGDQPIHVVDVIELTRGRRIVKVRKLFQKSDYEGYRCDDGEGNYSIIKPTKK